MKEENKGVARKRIDEIEVRSVDTLRVIADALVAAGFDVDIEEKPPMEGGFTMTVYRAVSQPHMVGYEWKC